MQYLFLAFIIFMVLSMTKSGFSPTTIAKVKSSYFSYAVTNSLRFNVDSLLILAVITVESGGKPDSVGLDGERGLMQVMQATFAGINSQFGFGYSWQEMFNPSVNIAVGSAYLSQCLAAFPGDRRAAIRAYNAGIPRAKKDSSISNAYADKVISAYKQFQSL